MAESAAHEDQDAAAIVGAGPALLRFSQSRGGLIVSAEGAWTIQHIASLDRDRRNGAGFAVPRPSAQGQRAEITTTGLAKLDTAGAWKLVGLEQALRAEGYQPEFVGLTADQKTLMEAIAPYGARAMERPPRSSPIARLLADAGQAFVAMGQDFSGLTGFLGALIAALGRVLLRPWRFRFTAFVHHLEHVGLRAVPIVFLICLLIGAVIMQQGAVQLAPFGAEPFAVDMLGILSLREIGVLLVSIMVAGRSASAFCAELGSMKMREEIDAMRALGMDVMEVLVVPRVLALIVVLPILTFIGDIACLVGGAIIAVFYLDIDLPIFLDRLQAAINTRHLFAGLVKAPFAAILIGLVGCREGLSVAGSAESLGTHVTSAVVKAIFLVIILDASFAMFLSAIGV